MQRLQQQLKILLKKAIVLWRFFAAQTKKIKLPFFEGLSLYDVVSFFFKGVYEGAVTMRAASVSFSLFLALFPGIIFIFTLIPYVPIDGFQENIFEVLSQVLPTSAYAAAEETIFDIINTKRGNLLSLSFIMALFFATNGTLALLTSFTYSYHKIDFKNIWQQYLSSLMLTVVLSVMALFSLVLVSLGKTFLMHLASKGLFEYSMMNYIMAGRLIILIFTVQLGISLLYNFGSVKGKQWKFFSPGSILATVLIIISSLAFGYYVDNFSQYNKLYGSIGTLMVIMLWIYVNAIGLIIGFELNAGIAGAKVYQARLKSKKESDSF